VTAIETILAKVTVTVVDPVAAWEDALIVAVPGETAVTKPPVLIEAMVVSEVDQNTPEPSVFTLPSL
jgi:hypothetical protein